MVGGCSNGEARGSMEGRDDVATRQAEDGVAVIAEAEVIANCALEPRFLGEGDSETGVRGEGMTELSDVAVEEWIEGRELGERQLRAPALNWFSQKATFRNIVPNAGAIYGERPRPYTWGQYRAR